MVDFGRTPMPASPWEEEDPFVSQFVLNSARDRELQRNYLRGQRGQTGPLDPWGNPAFQEAARGRAAGMMQTMRVPWYERNRATADRYFTQAMGDPRFRSTYEGIDPDTGAPIGFDPYTDINFLRSSRERAGNIVRAREVAMAPYYGDPTYRPPYGP